tara:strand:- start:76 stop:327 length:252 start_codon:yes stop_codon:yes gene_type:complete
MLTSKNRKAEILAAYQLLHEENLKLRDQLENRHTELTIADYANDTKRRIKTHQVEFNYFVDDCIKLAEWTKRQARKVELPKFV